MPKRFAVKAKQRCYKTTRVHATAMQCAIATCISSVQTSSQSHQPCTAASRNALTALKSSCVMARRAPTANPKDPVPEQGRLAPEGRVCNQKLMARQHAKRHGGHRTLPNVFFTFSNWNMEIGTVVKMVHDSTQKNRPSPFELM